MRVFKLFTMLFALLFVIGCGEDSKSPVAYTVFFYDDGYLVSELTQTVLSGTHIDLPDREKDGFVFDGWLLNNAGNPMTGKYTVTGSVAFHTKWTEIIAWIDVSTPEQLNDIRNNLSGNYRLTADISLSGYSAGAGWQPIGDDWLENPFTGRLDGKGYKITDLSINNGDFVGLFGYIDGGTVSNLGVETAENGITGFAAGIIAGNIYNTTIENCYTKGNISASHAGGIVFTTYGNSKIKNSYSDVSINISASDFNTPRVGGIAGDFGASIIENSYSKGSIIVISDSCAMVGGIAGDMYMEWGDNSKISNSYSTMSINVSVSSCLWGSPVGGIAGKTFNGAIIENSAAINPSLTITGDNTYVNRVVGSHSYEEDSLPIVTNNNFALSTMTVSGDTSEGNAGVGKTEAQLKTQSTYSAAVNGDGLGGLGWKFGNDDKNPWKWVEGGYPILYWQ